jgi:ornithine--oxo-acid transaminase
MALDLDKLVHGYLDEASSLHSKYVNHQLVRVLHATGFEVDYKRAEGAYLFDYENNKYLDFLSGFGVFALGRNHPKIKSALIKAIEMDLPNLVQFERSHLPALLARELSNYANCNLTKAFFCNSGAESVEAAIKFARAFTKRPRIIAFDHAFHGLTTGALSLNGSKEFKEPFGPLFPGSTILPYGDISKLAVEISKKDVACVVIEPIQGKGVYIASNDYWSKLSELCKKWGTLLVVDEVQTGVARTGRFYCFEHYGIEPDVVTMAKALSGGFIPIGVTLMRPEIHENLYNSMENAMIQSSTFGQNQLAMIAALATIETIKDENIIENAQVMGKLLRGRLLELKEEFDLIKDVRGFGLMIGIEFGEPKNFGAKSRWKLIEAARSGLFSQIIVGPLFKRHRIITQVAGDRINVIKLLPPLIIGQEEINYFVDSLKDVLKDAEKGTGLIYEFGKDLIKSAVKRR